VQSLEHPIDKACRLLGGRRTMADRLCVTQSAIGNWKVRGVPIVTAVAIELATAGAVTRRDLRPDDAHLIWPDLADADTHPAPTLAPQAQAAINGVAVGEGA